MEGFIVLIRRVVMTGRRLGEQSILDSLKVIVKRKVGKKTIWKETTVMIKKNQAYGRH